MTTTSHGPAFNGRWSRPLEARTWYSVTHRGVNESAELNSPMNCPSRLPALKAMQKRIASLICLMQKVFVWTGWYKDPRPEYAPLQTRSFSAGKWSLTWISEPGRYYSVQESTDG